MRSRESHVPSPIHALAFLAALAAPLSAQDLAASGGQLGSSLDFSLTGPPGELFVLLVSTNTGPTPLGLFDPTDPRVLDVGIDLLPYAMSGFFLTPSATASLPLPGNPVFHGTILYSQFVTLPGPTSTFDVLSNRADSVVAMPDASHHPIGNVVVARQGHTVNALPNDGVLVAGGDQPDGAGGLTTLASSEVYDPKSGTFSLTGPMVAPRSIHTGTTLLDGRVLLCGGYNDEGTGLATSSCELYDPSTGTFSAAASMSVGRTQHSATLITAGANAGKVFVVGGLGKFDLDDIFGSLGIAHASTELYDPASDSWTAGPDLAKPRFAHSASALSSNSRVLIVSGVEVTVSFGLPIPSFTNDCQLFLPGSNTLQAASPLPVSDGIAYAGMVTPAGGNPVFAGGADGNLATLTFNTHTTTYGYTPGSDTWTVLGNLNGKRAYGQLLDSGGDLLCIGGLENVDAITGSGTPQQRIERSTNGGLTWTSSGSMATLLPREVSRSVLIDAGQKLITVGVANGGLAPVDATAEVFLQN